MSAQAVAPVLSPRAVEGLASKLFTHRRGTKASWADLEESEHDQWRGEARDLLTSVYGEIVKDVLARVAEPSSTQSAEIPEEAVHLAAEVIARALRHRQEQIVSGSMGDIQTETPNQIAEEALADAAPALRKQGAEEEQNRAEKEELDRFFRDESPEQLPEARGHDFEVPDGLIEKAKAKGADQERQRIAEAFKYREGEDPEGLQDAQAGLEGLLEDVDLHDPNCGIPHPADPDQGARDCTCGVGAAKERFSEAIALALDQVREGERQQLKEALEEEIRELNRFAAMATAPAYEAIWITAANRLQAALDTLEAD